MKPFVLFFLTVSGGYASAQQVESLYDSPSYAEPNIYYKDLYNDLDPFVGTWMYTDGNTSLTITLQKKARVSRNTVRNRLNYTFYEDMLVGGNSSVIEKTKKSALHSARRIFALYITYFTYFTYYKPMLSSCCERSSPISSASSETRNGINTLVNLYRPMAPKNEKMATITSAVM